MRISDRYERFADRVGPSRTAATKELTAAQPVDKTAAATGTASTGKGVLTVFISDHAAQLARGTAKLDELKARIHNGTYKVDARAIAKSLIGEDG